MGGAPRTGNPAALQESTRAMWGWTVLEQLIQDLRYALRTMLHNRAFTALSLVSLALGIGANTASYSFMDSILLRALPVADPDALALLNWHSKEPKGIRPNHVVHRWPQPRAGSPVGRAGRSLGRETWVSASSRRTRARCSECEILG